MFYSHASLQKFGHVLREHMSASRHTSTVVVLVRSARPRAAQREAIRTTWASRASGAVVFVLANISCGVPEAARASFGAHCAWAPGQRGIAVETSNLDALVRLESERHDDIVFADHVDTHRSSNAWLKQACLPLPWPAYPYPGRATRPHLGLGWWSW